MPHTTPVDASPIGGPRSLRCRRLAGTGHRAVAGELAALAFQLPVVTTDGPARGARSTPVPRPRVAT